MYRVVFRADGGSKIGLGHIMRSTVLADKLGKFAETIFVCKKGEEYTAGINYIKNKGFNVVEFETDNLLITLANVGGDCLITDSYIVSEVYFEKTKKIFKYTGYIDDLNKHYFNVDFIINQNIYAEDFCYNVNPHTKLFLGPGYFLLRDEFAKLPTRKLKNDVKDIMITLGGSDPNNLTMKIVELIKNAALGLNIHIVIGPSFYYRNELEIIQSHEIKTYFNPARISDIMLDCDLAISACGGTLYELAACGTPTIGVVVADNQELNAEKMAAIGAINYCNKLSGLPGIIKGMDFKKRNSMSMVGRKLVDGLGSDRLASEIYNLIKLANDKKLKTD